MSVFLEDTSHDTKQQKQEKIARRSGGFLFIFSTTALVFAVILIFFFQFPAALLVLASIPLMWLAEKLIAFGSRSAKRLGKDRSKPQGPGKHIEQT